MTRVFVDSGAFFAHLVVEDAFHARARMLFEQAADEGWLLATTNAVVIESHALIVSRARQGRALAVEFLDCLDAGLCDVERVTVEDEAAAKGLVRSHADKEYSLCDALSFVVMARLGITKAMAFDRHFREYGRFTIL